MTDRPTPADELEERLQATLAGKAETARVPEGLATSSRRRAARRRNGAVGAAAALVAVVLLGGAALQQSHSKSDSTLEVPEPAAGPCRSNGHPDQSVGLPEELPQDRLGQHSLGPTTTQDVDAAQLSLLLHFTGSDDKMGDAVICRAFFTSGGPNGISDRDTLIVVTPGLTTVASGPSGTPPISSTPQPAVGLIVFDFATGEMLSDETIGISGTDVPSGRVDCDGTTAVLTQGDHEVRLFPQSEPRSITLYSGSASVTRSGPCADELAVGPNVDYSVLDPGSELSRSARFDLSPGTATLTASLPMCAGWNDPGCRGGVGRSGVYAVTVLPSDNGGSPATSGTPVDLPTSDWEPGDFSMQALITGVLEVDDDGCLFLRSQEGFGSFYAVWPHGYTATRTGGTVTLFDAAGRPAAVEGQAIRAGGGEVSRERVDLDSGCLPDTGDVTLIQSSVTVDDLGP